MAEHAAGLLYAYRSGSSGIAVVASDATHPGATRVIGTWPADEVVPLLERYGVKLRW